MALRRLKMRICLMFRSCKSKHHITNDVFHDPPPPSRHYHNYCQFIQLLSPKPNPFSLSLMEDQTKQLYSLKKTDHQTQGGKCPPASPILSPLSHSSSKSHSQKDKSRNPTSHKQRIRNYNKKYCTNFTDHFPDGSYNSLFGSKEEDEDNTTMFSSESSHQYSLRCRNKSSSTSRRRRAAADPIVEDSLAVVKQSSDPYSDFRTSMVEMIVENQIYGAKDLQNLLQCFLSLNSRHHHKLIVQVFTEIWETLFSSGS